MEFLHELIQSLTPAEVKGVRAELKLRKKNQQIEKVFETLLKLKTNSSLFENLNSIVKTSNSKRLHILENKLRELILEYLLSDNNLKRNETEESIKAHITIRKKTNQYGYLLRYKNHLQLNPILLEEIISISKKYEYYPGIIDGLYKKRQYQGTRLGLDEYIKFNREIDYYMQCYNLFISAEGFYLEVNSERVFNGSLNLSDAQTRLWKNIEYLRNGLKNIESSVITYFCICIELEYYKNNHDYKRVKELALKKIDLLKANKAVYHKLRIGIAYDDLAVSEIMLGNYDQAINFIYQAEKYFSQKSYNYWTTQSLLLLSLFYLKEYSESEKVIDLALQEKKSISKYKYSTFLIFKAYTLFARQNFKQALKVLSQPLELTSDKTGWDITVRVLTIMTLTELGHLDEATQHIDRLRKHVERYSKKDFVTDRNITITNLLRTLARHEFNFKHPSLDRYLRQLRSPEQAWKPLTPELTPVEVWVKK